MKERHKVVLCVYVILEREGRILLSLRQNTGFEDDKWCLVGGHCEPAETAREGLIREVKEEIGIHIDPEDLRLLHVMHRRSDRENIDLFMHCQKWQGDIDNCEPDKCGGLQFFDRTQLPENLIVYVKDALEKSQGTTLYSESGWGQAEALNR